MSLATSNEVLGVIGGAGVAAAIKFNELMEVSMTQNGAFRDMHHPEVIVFQATQVPSRSMFLEGRGPTFIPGYIEIGKKLKSAGATLLCMTCNTAHAALDEIQEGVGLPFINLIEEVAKAVQEKKVKRIGLMASDGARRGLLYEKYLQQYCQDIELVYPSKLLQEKITLGICNIKNNSRFKHVEHADRPRRIFQEICQSYLEDDVELVIAGCTDIRVDFQPDDYSLVPVLDSLEILSKIALKKIQTAR